MKSSRPLSAHCRSSKARITGLDGGEPLEEQPPAAEQIRAVGSGPLLEAQQVRQTGLDEATLALIRHVLGDRGAELLTRGRRILLLDDPRARTDHFGQRPIGHALAVGETATLVPPAEVLDSVDVLEELPQQARLARSGFTHDRDHAARGARMH